MGPGRDPVTVGGDIITLHIRNVNVCFSKVHPESGSRIFPSTATTIADPLYLIPEHCVRLAWYMAYNS
ncbi:hypothetical protein EYZ11_009561 [Aspergillus tanneri]|uniref:Uncharacterized protein n=1 Tax=Aspergillus tanneri TaxID=1220188 RepID=A0A4S3J826_9EURO|nr:hypothetical protein EYZ11_009561 [Aspergillus tanneri]